MHTSIEASIVEAASTIDFKIFYNFQGKYISFISKSLNYKWKQWKQWKLKASMAKTLTASIDF